MVQACALPATGAPVVQSLADYVDCHAQALGENGFQAMSGGWFMPAMLTACLTLYVAVIGYRLLLGQTYGPRDAIMACVRAGLVITFCTSWPSYEAVAYRVITQAPVEVATATLASVGLPSSTAPSTAGRLAADYATIQTINTRAAARAPPPPPLPGAAAAPTPGQTPPGPASSSNPPEDGEPTYTFAGYVFLTSTLGAFLAVRLAAGVVLAIGPVIIALSLFDNFLGLFEGWVRALLGAALAAVGAAVVTALEVGFVEAELLGGGDPNPMTDQTLLIVGILFGLITWVALIIAVIVAKGFRLRLGRLVSPTAALETSGSARGGPAAQVRDPVIERLEGRSRAQAVADAVVVQGQRERHELIGAPSQSLQIAGAVSSQRASPAHGDPAFGTPPLGSSLRRTATTRRTHSTNRREGAR